MAVIRLSVPARVWPSQWYALMGVPSESQSLCGHDDSRGVCAAFAVCHVGVGGGILVGVEGRVVGGERLSVNYRVLLLCSVGVLLGEGHVACSCVFAVQRPERTEVRLEVPAREDGPCRVDVLVD